MASSDQSSNPALPLHSAQFTTTQWSLVLHAGDSIDPESESALAQLGKTGTLCLLGTGMDKPELDAMRILLNELVVTGAYEYDENGLAAALELIASGRLATDLLIDATDVGLEDLQGAMEELVNGKIAGKVLVAPN